MGRIVRPLEEKRGRPPADWRARGELVMRHLSRGEEVNIVWLGAVCGLTRAQMVRVLRYLRDGGLAECTGLGCRALWRAVKK